MPIEVFKDFSNVMIFDKQYRTSWSFISYLSNDGCLSYLAEIHIYSQIWYTYIIKTFFYEAGPI